MDVLTGSAHCLVVP